MLQFYGASSLAKAVILANTTSTLVDIRFHGLSTTPARVPQPLAVNLEAYSRDPTQWSMETEFAVSQPDGVFPELCKALAEPLPKAGVVMRFQELLRLDPDLATAYVRHYGEPSHCFYVDVHEETAEKKLRIHLLRTTPEHVQQVFPELAGDFDGGETSFISKAPASLPLPYAATQHGTVAGTYLVRPLDWGLKHSLAVNFAALFILSNVVRYKPAFWMDTLEGHQSGAASMAEAFCNAARRRLPNDALNAIWHEEFSYGAPARLA